MLRGSEHRIRRLLDSAIGVGERMVSFPCSPALWMVMTAFEVMIIMKNNSTTTIHQHPRGSGHDVLASKANSRVHKRWLKVRTRALLHAPSVRSLYLTVLAKPILRPIIDVRTLSDKGVQRALEEISLMASESKDLIGVIIGKGHGLRCGPACATSLMSAEAY